MQSPDLDFGNQIVKCVPTATKTITTTTKVNDDYV